LKKSKKKRYYKILEKTAPLKLKLYAPLVYTEVTGIDPLDFRLSQNEAVKQLVSKELLFCFEIDPEQSGRIDPHIESFPGKLVFTGESSLKQGNPAGGLPAGSNPTGSLPTGSIPAGLYFFSQVRRLLNLEECVYRAIELQKDGLWERLRLDNRLYIRYLFEDGRPVTQFFRPVI